jgi:MerR family transcriptional regulator, copper efflux regulator
MNIAEVAAQSGLPAKTIRYYEDIGLVRPARAANGYRVFTPREVNQLSFVGRARSLGFSVEDCRALLALYHDTARHSSDVKRLAEGHLQQIAARITALQAMQDTLSVLVQGCAGDNRPDCPILSDLSGNTPKGTLRQPQEGLPDPGCH